MLRFWIQRAAKPCTWPAFLMQKPLPSLSYSFIQQALIRLNQCQCKLLIHYSCSSNNSLKKSTKLARVGTCMLVDSLTQLLSARLTVFVFPGLRTLTIVAIRAFSRSKGFGKLGKIGISSLNVHRISYFTTIAQQSIQHPLRDIIR